MAEQSQEQRYRSLGYKYDWNTMTWDLVCWRESTGPEWRVVASGSSDALVAAVRLLSLPDGPVRT